MLSIVSNVIMFLEKQVNTHLINLIVYQNRIPISSVKTLDPRKDTHPQSRLYSTWNITEVK